MSACERIDIVLFLDAFFATKLIQFEIEMLAHRCAFKRNRSLKLTLRLRLNALDLNKTRSQFFLYSISPIFGQWEWHFEKVVGTYGRIIQRTLNVLLNCLCQNSRTDEALEKSWQHLALVYVVKKVMSADDCAVEFRRDDSESAKLRVNLGNQELVFGDFLLFLCFDLKSLHAAGVKVFL